MDITVNEMKTGRIIVKLIQLLNLNLDEGLIAKVNFDIDMLMRNGEESYSFCTEEKKIN